MPKFGEVKVSITVNKQVVIDKIDYQRLASALELLDDIYPETEDPIDLSMSSLQER